MQTKDHLELGRHLSLKLGLQGSYKTAFILGNIAPDINLFSYLSGFKSLVPAGHHCKFALEKSKKLIQRIENIRNEWLYFYELGVIMHYLADSFTYSHSENYPCKYSPHTAYERELHKKFKEYADKCSKFSIEIISNSQEFIDNMQNGYAIEHHNTETDCRYVLNVTKTVTVSMYEKRKSSEYLKKQFQFPFRFGFFGENKHSNVKN